MPPLLCAVHKIQWSMHSGKSIKESMEAYLRSSNDELSERLRELWALKQNGRDLKRADYLKTHYQNAFWEVIERALAGQPVTDALKSLEEEILIAAQSELDKHVLTLPFKALVPLLFFQFPAFLVVLLGPLLRELQSQLGAGL